MRTNYLILVVVFMIAWSEGLAGNETQTASESQIRKIPVIYDSDIGGDIDDMWALCFMLASPELDVKLVVTDTHDTEGKAKIFAKLLERIGRTDIPIGIGVKQSDSIGPQGGWVKDYDLSKYPGKVYKDGIQAIVDTIMKSSEPVTVIAVGPVPNISRAILRNPAITQKARLVLMGGSINIKYGRQKGRCAEYNVKHRPVDAHVAYGADWNVTMTPLDTADFVILKGDSYKRVKEADNPLAQSIMESYRIWIGKKRLAKTEVASSTLFDTVAVYLAFASDLCEMQDIRLRVTDRGLTVPDPNGKLTRVAVKWKDLKAFETLLADRLANYKCRK